MWATEVNGFLGLEPGDFWVIGRALQDFANGAASDPEDEDDREQAAGLHETLSRWNYLPASKPHPAGPHPGTAEQAAAHTDGLHHPART